MSEETKPEVLPGDLITGPGVYESRSHGVVEVRHWDEHGWVAQWEDAQRHYAADGTRPGIRLFIPDPWQLLRWVGPLPEGEPTTSEQIAEIEDQAAEYTPPEGWRVLQIGEMLQDGDQIVQLDDGKRYPTYLVGCSVGAGQRYIRRIEPEPQPEAEPDPEPQPVQIREGRWRTRGGEIRNIIPTPAEDERAVKYSWHDINHDQTWLPNGRYHTSHTESPLDLWEYLGPIEPEPEQTITPDDVAAEALAGVYDETQGLQMQVRFLKDRESMLETRLEEEKAVTTKRLQQVEELRSEVSHVQRLWGESRRRVEELETLVADLRAVNAATERAVNSAALDKADLQHRLDTVAAEWALQAGQISGLQQQLEAVKAESAKRLETIQELRSEVSQVHRQWGDSRWRVEELEQKLAEPEASPVHQQAMIDAQAETIARLNSEIHELNIDIVSLDSQLEDVKAELVQERLERNQWQNHAQRTETQLVEKVNECRTLRIELDALQQAPQAETDAEMRVKLLRHANDTQAETIGRLQSEIRDLRVELAETEQARDAFRDRVRHLETMSSTHAETISGLHSEIHALNMEIGGLNRERSQKDDRIGYLETMNAGQATAVETASERNARLRTIIDNARQQLEAAADEISELRQSLDASEKQLDQKDAQIRDLKIELDAAQQVPKPMASEQQEQIWDQATKFAGQQLVGWLRPLVHALNQQPDERLLRFMAMTLSVLPDIVPQVLGYGEEAEDAEE